MKIKKYEQSGFVIDSENGFRLAIDIGKYTPIENAAGIVAEKPVDAFLVSHIHGDHFSAEHINALAPKMLYLNAECKESDEGRKIQPEAQIEIVKVGDTKQIGPFSVKFFSVDHGPNISLVPKENFGFLIEEQKAAADGTPSIVDKTYFAGDVFYAPGESSQLEEGKLYVDQLEVDIALIPVGTFYTFGPQEAFEFAKQFKRIGKIVPMHYEKTPETNGEFRELCEGRFECA